MAVAAGRYHTMVVKQDGSLWATGRNEYGQLGDGSTTDKHSFVEVITNNVKVVATGYTHTMVVKQDGSVWATGENWAGQLGDGSSGVGNYRNSFVKVIPTTTTDSSTTGGQFGRM